MVDPPWEERVRRGIFLVADSKFEEGLAIFQAYIDTFPKRPEGYFLYAAGVQERIQKLDAMDQLPLFFEYVDKCKENAEEVMDKDESDPVARLTYGAIHGYVGMIEARRRNLVSAFFSLRTAKKYLEALHKERKDIPDARFGLGMVYYYASRKSAEEGGMVAWVIESFITGADDRRAEGEKLLESAIRDEAYSTDYARSALMWIRLYNREYGKVKEMAEPIAARFPSDTMSRWALGRVALVERKCEEADSYFTAIQKVHQDLGADPKKYPDVTMARMMAKRCSLIRDKKIGDARTVNRKIGVWLDKKPKAVIEYQDEKNLIAHWRREWQQSQRLLQVLKERTDQRHDF